MFVFLQVSMLYSATVVCDLLLSCYTGMLQFNPEEIVNYLTAASYLQMEHIVERCRGALKKYVQLKNPSPKVSIPGNKNMEKHLFSCGMFMLQNKMVLYSACQKK